MSIRIAVDLGGTHIRAASYRRDETRPLKHQKIKTRSKNETLLERILNLIESVIPEGEIPTAIGIAAPGPLNPRTGVILNTPNIPDWENYPIADKVNARFHIPVYLGNDANLAGLGEWRYGAGQGHENLLYLTISTGIGGGVISDGHLLEGWQGLAGELGHVTVVADGPVCGCGHKGHLEAFSSGTGIARYVEEQLEDDTVESSLRSRAKRTAELIAEAARKGDPLAVSAYERAGKYLGIGVASFLHIFNPSILIFGGGVSQSGELLWTPFRKSLQEHIFNPAYLENLVITPAALGDDAGLLGALALVGMKEKTKENSVDV
ncbi:MAG: ROK family protein [Anaerolineae bacterium]|jgi:glucokinase|nr:ROK family protein [Anaerolineae bacterium]MBT7072477.1 ROK family protein [Anaerolineae bacterium]MBT7325706.1 ROK family protein [Anaerolineae bacterium]